MSSELQKVLAGLHDVMALAAQQSFEGEAINWISSNFDLVSRSGEEFLALKDEVSRLDKELQETKEKMTKPTLRSGSGAKQAASEAQMGVDNEGHKVQLSGDAIQDPETTQTFMDRANATKMTDRNDHFRKIVSQIKKSASSGGGDAYAGGSMMADADPAEIEEMEQMLSGGSPIVQSGIEAEYDDDDALPPIAEAFIAGGTGKQQGYNPRDIAKLQQLQQKSARASRALDGGGSVGLIRR